MFDSARALAVRARWTQPFEAALLEGGEDAAALVAGLELVVWLEARGLATPALQRRLLEQRLYGFEPVVVRQLDASDEADQLWCAALQQRLRQLELNPGA